MKKLKTFVITVSKQFPKTHPSAGKPTDFESKMFFRKKKHTIRGNYEWWKPRIDAINRGEAILSVRQWIGLPYHKPGQNEIAVFGKGEVGIQCISIFQRMDEDDLNMSIFVGNEGKESEMPFYFSRLEDGEEVTYGEDQFNQLISNDGLTYDDFKAWFKEDVNGGCIIHFTDLRY